MLLERVSSLLLKISLAELDVLVFANEGCCIISSGPSVDTEVDAFTFVNSEPTAIDVVDRAIKKDTNNDQCLLNLLHYFLPPSHI
jgi:hypothetical protein